MRLKMKIESLALGDNIQNQDYLSDIRNALLGLALNMCQIYQEDSKSQVYQLVFPFLKDKTNQRMYFFIAFIDDEQKGFHNRLYTNIIPASHFENNDMFSQLTLHVCNIIPKGIDDLKGTTPRPRSEVISES